MAAYDAGLAAVSETLWRERELLELLTFKLDVERVLAESGSSRWLDHAAREVDLLLDEVRRTEVFRAAQVDDIAGALGLAPGPTLRAIAAAAGDAWAMVLEDHRRELTTATAEVSAAASRTRYEDLLEDVR
jgi:hypothetical protein